MNRKVFITLIILIGFYLAGFYVLKFFFPEQFLLCLTDTNLLKFGSFLESNIILYYISKTIFGSITYYLFACCCAKKMYLSIKETIYVIVCSILTIIINKFLPTIAVHSVISLMLILALLCNGYLYTTVVAFIVNGYMQLSMLSIRGYETILPVMNLGTNLALTTECWVWLIVLYLIFNLKKRREEK